MIFFQSLVNEIFCDALDRSNIKPLETGVSSIHLGINNLHRCGNEVLISLPCEVVEFVKLLVTNDKSVCSFCQPICRVFACSLKMLQPII